MGTLASFAWGNWLQSLAKKRWLSRTKVSTWIQVSFGVASPAPALRASEEERCRPAQVTPVGYVASRLSPFLTQACCRHTAEIETVRHPERKAEGLPRRWVVVSHFPSFWGGVGGSQPLPVSKLPCLIQEVLSSERQQWVILKWDLISMPRNCLGTIFQGGKNQYTVYYQKLGTTCGRACR